MPAFSEDKQFMLVPALNTAQASVFILVGWQKLLFETYGQEDGKKKKSKLLFFLILVNFIVH